MQNQTLTLHGLILPLLAACNMATPYKMEGWHTNSPEVSDEVKLINKIRNDDLQLSQKNSAPTGKVQEEGEKISVGEKVIQEAVNIEADNLLLECVQAGYKIFSKKLELTLASILTLASMKKNKRPVKCENTVDLFLEEANQFGLWTDSCKSGAHNEKGAWKLKKHIADTLRKSLQDNTEQALLPLALDIIEIVKSDKEDMLKVKEFWKTLRLITDKTMKVIKDASSGSDGGLEKKMGELRESHLEKTQENHSPEELNGLLIEYPLQCTLEYFSLKLSEIFSLCP